MHGLHEGAYVDYYTWTVIPWLASTKSSFGRDVVGVKGIYAMTHDTSHPASPCNSFTQGGCRPKGAAGCHAHVPRTHHRQLLQEERLLLSSGD